jgi:hypothetical protein
VVRYSRYPLPVRRLLWWLGLNLSGRNRVRTFGSFGLTTVGSAGAEIRHLIAVVPTCLTYGPLGPDGGVTVGLQFDHRVMDGATVAEALADLERTLCGEVLAELHSLTKS